MYGMSIILYNSVYISIYFLLLSDTFSVVITHYYLILIGIYREHYE